MAEKFGSNLPPSTAVTSSTRPEPTSPNFDALSDVSSIHSSDITSDDEDDEGRADFVRLGEDLTASTWTDLGSHSEGSDQPGILSSSASTSEDGSEPDFTSGSSPESGKVDVSFTDGEDSSSTDGDRTLSALRESFTDLGPSIPSKSWLSPSTATITILPDTDDAQPSVQFLRPRSSSTLTIGSLASTPDLKSGLGAHQRLVNEEFKLAFPDPATVSSSFSSPGSSYILPKVKQGRSDGPPSFRSASSGGPGSTDARSTPRRGTAPASASVSTVNVSSLAGTDTVSSISGGLLSDETLHPAPTKTFVSNGPGLKLFETFPTSFSPGVTSQILGLDWSANTHHHPIHVLLLGSSPSASQHRAIVSTILRLLYSALSEETSPRLATIREYDLLGGSEKTRIISDLREPFRRERKASFVHERKRSLTATGRNSDEEYLRIEIGDLTADEDDDLIAADREIAAHLASLKSCPRSTILAFTLVNPNQPDSLLDPARHARGLQQLFPSLAHHPLHNTHTLILPLDISASFNPANQLTLDRLRLLLNSADGDSVWAYDEFVRLGGKRDASQVWKEFSARSEVEGDALAGAVLRREEAEEAVARVVVDWRRLKHSVWRYFYTASILATAFLASLSCLEYAFNAFNQPSSDPVINTSPLTATSSKSFPTHSSEYRRPSEDSPWTAVAPSAATDPVVQTPATAKSAVSSETSRNAGPRDCVRQTGNTLLEVQAVALWRDDLPLLAETCYRRPTSLWVDILNRSGPISPTPLNSTLTSDLQLEQAYSSKHLLNYLRPTLSAISDGFRHSVLSAQYTLEMMAVDPKGAIQAALSKTFDPLVPFLEGSKLTAQEMYTRLPTTLRSLQTTLSSGLASATTSAVETLRGLVSSCDLSLPFDFQQIPRLVHENMAKVHAVVDRAVLKVRFWYSSFRGRKEAKRRALGSTLSRVRKLIDDPAKVLEERMKPVAQGFADRSVLLWL